MICKLSNSTHDLAPEFKLGPGDIHIWMAAPDEIDDAALSDYQTLLSETEDQQWRRFHFEKDRRLHLISRALVRTTLSGYTGAEPRAITFSENKYGKPEISAPERRHIRFNLSHTQGLILCGIALTEDIGVDVECPGNRDPEMAEIAQRFFSPAEARDLADCPKEMQKNLFFHYWTLKEAFIKAMGRGLSLPLNQFAFDLSREKKPRISFSHPDDPSGIWTDNDPKDWLFQSLCPSPRHIAAVAVKRKKGIEYRVSVKKFMPNQVKIRLP